MQRRQGFVLFYLCAAIGALTVLAAGLPQLSFRPGRSFLLNTNDTPDAGSGALDVKHGRSGLFALGARRDGAGAAGLFCAHTDFSSKLRWQLLQRIAQVLVVVLLFLPDRQPADRHARRCRPRSQRMPCHRR